MKLTVTFVKNINFHWFCFEIYTKCESYGAPYYPVIFAINQLSGGSVADTAAIYYHFSFYPVLQRRWNWFIPRILISYTSLQWFTILLSNLVAVNIFYPIDLRKLLVQAKLFKGYVYHFKSFLCSVQAYSELGDFQYSLWRTE